MECEKIRDLFSSLLERELNSTEEKIVREHLASCPECQKDYDRFNKTIQWLHSIGEEEVPEGFLPEIYKKVEERKGKAPRGEKIRGKWFNDPHSMKIPIQAAAMVATLFLVIYITKMIPYETNLQKDLRQGKAPFSEGEKTEEKGVSNVTEKDRSPGESPPEVVPKMETHQAKSPVPVKERVKEAPTPKVMKEVRPEAAPSQKTRSLTTEVPHLTEGEKTEVLQPEMEKKERGMMAKESSPRASKPPEEIVLRISDREKILLKLREMVRQFGGEIVKTEGNVLFVSLPTGLSSEFEKELVGLSSSMKDDKMSSQKDATEGLRVAAGMKKREIREMGKGPAGLAIDEKSYVTIQIFLIQE